MALDRCIDAGIHDYGILSSQCECGRCLTYFDFFAFSLFQSCKIRCRLKPKSMHAGVSNINVTLVKATTRAGRRNVNIPRISHLAGCSSSFWPPKLPIYRKQHKKFSDTLSNRAGKKGCTNARDATETRVRTDSGSIGLDNNKSTLFRRLLSTS